MRIFKKAATSMVAVGLLAFGAVAGSGGSALAASAQPVTGCSATIGALAIGLFPNCTAGTSTIANPVYQTVSQQLAAARAMSASDAAQLIVLAKQRAAINPDCPARPT